MRKVLAIVVTIGVGVGAFLVARGRAPALKLAPGWAIELVAEAPAILFPTAIVSAPDGTIYLGQDPMDMPGPVTSPIDRVVAIKNGKITVFAEKLNAVMGLEWAAGTLYVVHAPYLSALTDTDGDGRADRRVDLVTGLGPDVPAFNGINDHIASGVRLGIDGFLYVSVGDKGIPRSVGADGASIQLHGGGVIRVRPDGSNLEVVSTGERNPMSVALSPTDEIFTYGNDDDRKKWPNSLTHHIVGGHYGYPYEFLRAPGRCLPIVDGRIGGAGAQGLCYNDDGLAPRFHGNLFFCDWGLGAVTRYELEPAGATFRLKAKEFIVRRGNAADFRPISLTVGDEGRSLYLADWGCQGYLLDGPQTGRLYRLTYHGDDQVAPTARPPLSSPADWLAALDHPSLAVRLVAQRQLAAAGANAEPALASLLKSRGSTTSRIHALWALDAINSASARAPIRDALVDPEVAVQTQAARSSGIRRDRAAGAALARLLEASEPVIRREAAIALGRIGDATAVSPLLAALADSDRFVSWSIRAALRTIDRCDVTELTAALTDPARRDAALALCDEWWSLGAVKSLTRAIRSSPEAAWRARAVETLGALYRRYPEWSGYWFGPDPLAGAVPRKTRDWDPVAMAAVLDGVAMALEDAEPSVRQKAIKALADMGPKAADRLRARLGHEPVAAHLLAIAGALAEWRDGASLPGLIALLNDATRPIEVRQGLLAALERFPGAASAQARLALVRDVNSPVALAARAVNALARERAITATELMALLDHVAPPMRMAALGGLIALGNETAAAGPAIRARLDDNNAEVRRAAIEAAAALKIVAAVPPIIELAHAEDLRATAIKALAAMPDARALPVLLEGLDDHDPSVRQSAEAALVALRDSAGAEIDAHRRGARLPARVAEALDRVFTRYRPIVDWKVIGPFARNTPPLFTASTPVDLTREYVGASGRTVTWADRAADALTGRVVLEDLKAGAGESGGFGYDQSSSPDLAADAFAQVTSDRETTALARIGSSGTITLSVNGERVFQEDVEVGRAFAPDSNLVRMALKKGTNALSVRSRQGLGTWSFSVQIQVMDGATPAPLADPGAPVPEALRDFALTHRGDPARGQALFFDRERIECGKCHSAGGRGAATAGPDLTGLALKYDRAEIIRSILEPSQRIATGYQPVLLATHDGAVITGIVRAETESALELIDATARPIRVLKADVETRATSAVSLMPAGLVNSLTPSEFADLIAYLESTTPR